MSTADTSELIAEFLRLREDSESERARGGRYSEAVGRLDHHFWELVEEAVFKALASAGEELVFGQGERLLIDTGLLDESLVARAGRNCLEKLTAEVQTRGPEGLFYLSEWLSARYKSYLATRTLPDEKVAESMLLKAAAELDEELTRARQQRNELYRRIAGLFENLPGISAELTAAMVRGTVDDRIEELLLAEVLSAPATDGKGDEEAGRQARRYDQAAQKVLRLARERTEGEDDLLYLDTIGRLRLAIFRKSAVRARRARKERGDQAEVPVESRPAPEPALEEVRAFMHRELRLMRSLLRIGSQEGKVAQACSVLLHDAPRTTKPAAAAVLDLAREVDPHVGLTHNVLIAPFTGSGFFEWDRDTLIVALSPARGVEEAVVNAVANFRLLADARQGSGMITAAYRQMHGAEFRERFLEDYRAWVLRVGRGRREALSERTFEFFVEHLGPAAGGPVVPGDMIHLSVGEREQETRRLEAALRERRADAREFHRLAVLLWQAERIDEAIRAMEQAAEAAPEEGQVLYSLGLLCRRRRLTGKARKAFRDCTQVAPNTLWSIYAHEALRRMG